MSTDRHGPYGCNNSPNWRLVLESTDIIKEVIIYHGYIVDAIGFVVADNHGRTTTQVFGGNGGNHSKITLRSGEYITQVSGNYGIYSYTNSYVIGSLTIRTNLGAYGPYGLTKAMLSATSFSSPVILHFPIVEFFGRQDGVYLQSIGFSVRKGPSLEEKKARERAEEKKKQEEEKKAREKAEQEEEKKAREKAEEKKRQEEEKRAREKAEEKKKQEEEKKAREIAEEKKKQEEEKKAREKAEEKKKQEEEKKAREKAEEKKKQEEEKKAREKVEEKKKQEEKKKGDPMEERSDNKRGSIAFFATYRPPVALDIYSAPDQPKSRHDEVLMTDGMAYNYNGQVIPPLALKTMLKRPLMASHGTEDDVDSGRLSGLIFVSERTNSLETLHIALLFQDQPPKVFNFAEVYDTFKGVRMEDSGCIAGNYLIYVSTMEPASEPHQPWTAVYKTNLTTAITERLTLKGQADLSPSVSPDGKRIAVASFQRKAGWDGEIEDLKTSIFVMNVDRPLNRQLVVVDGGWPTWGSDNVLFFHRNIEKVKIEKRWGVFRVDLRVGSTSITRVTPEEISAMTPAAIDETRVVVATLRRRFTFDEQDEREEDQYRHIEIFDMNKPLDQSTKITQITRSMADHFNPFVIDDNKGGKRIGYHRCNSDKVNAYNVVEKDFYKLQSPNPDIGVIRVSGVFPSISKCGTKLAFVDNEFKAVWVADDKGLHMVYKRNDSNSIFSPVWSNGQDILYVCVGPSFNLKATVQILAIVNVSAEKRDFKWLTAKGFNSAFPSTNADGTRLVYRSTKDGPKNLYIMENALLGEFEGAKVTRLTEGNWTDTHCQWSPKQDWIVFASNRSNPTAKTPQDLPDPGFFGVYLVKANDKTVVVKVMDSGYTYLGDLFPGHVNHPFFSPDGESLVVAADLAAVSCDPVSMPLFVHSVRPYGDIFILDINRDDIYKNENLKKFTRVTHSKYENSTATWTMTSTKDLHAKWNVRIAGNDDAKRYRPECPYVHKGGAESFHMTGHLCIPDKRCC
ncbi:uncharacterized protein LOC104891772 isoform X2 [Beta vulgaris subsp. vulgaris]|uniref:uncharacterized protein LOC104891772 isoform X2 n=1 Tax=Beta vulgaris subsp. vulgaris TaxID=3555 RepID=UPI00203734B3|nr:uncharacterized protein LOC104891772 isoform X2 [Beta vulgaris subsp. vulgaris]